ncbi:MAG: hypothetical protein LH475_07250 [Cryobacterium sp.]|uniref:hypothetical protein n=1 Tax=unclassified Cryobacterium TaxID=2649013 RepID=UPI0018C9F571|nr:MULTISPECIES: hypothetical protein [unclassified Cryobacterium]MCY7404405.1 hypothetical protein [Cryobacterium sp.]MEC5155788.1 hypothetical protein [Cryobacterium sp. CAN_C3]
MGAVFLPAGAAIKAMEIEGDSIRDDGFWDGEHSHGYEFAEGVLMVAVNNFEERKLPYMANILANVSMSASIDAPTANFILKSAERLSWLDRVNVG